MRIRATLCLLLAGAPTAWALDDSPAQRQALVDERQQIERSYRAQEADCRGRFVVTACVDAARQTRRQALAQVRAKEWVLDQEERKRRATDRADRLRARERAGPRGGNEDATPRHANRSSAAASVAPAVRLRSIPDKTPRNEGKLSAEQEQRNRAAFDAKQRDAQARRDAAEQRQRDQAQKQESRADGTPGSKAPQALPVPSAASAASSP